MTANRGRIRDAFRISRLVHAHVGHRLSYLSTDLAAYLTYRP